MTSTERRRRDGLAIKTQRELRSMKQSELAVLIGVSDSAISRYEAGIRDVPELLQHSIAMVFGVDVDKLFPVVRCDDRPRSVSAA